MSTTATEVRMSQVGAGWDGIFFLQQSEDQVLLNSEPEEVLDFATKMSNPCQILTEACFDLMLNGHHTRAAILRKESRRRWPQREECWRWYDENARRLAGNLRVARTAGLPNTSNPVLSIRRTVFEGLGRTDLTETLTAN